MNTPQRIVDRPVDLAGLVASVTHDGAGAVVTFAGTVRDRNQGRAVTGIEYSAYRSMAERELAAILAEAEGRLPGLRAAAEHRVGALAVGEPSVAIATSHPHRAEAYEGNRYVIEELKRRLPVWKRELYVDGTREWVAAAAATPAAEVGR
jgi:molybdopterin synthase catalytic subunit